MAEETVFNQQFVLKRDADISITLQGPFSYTSGNGSQRYMIRCVVDGATIKSVAGATKRDDYCLQAGQKGMAAGTHTLQVFFWADAGMNIISSQDLVMIARYR